LKICWFGLTLTSSWGNGHATPYRAILRALSRRDVRSRFYEKDVPYYARHRDFASCDYCDLVLYQDWSSIRHEALKHARESDIVVIASYCPEGARIADEVLELEKPLHVFYDLDTPITLRGLNASGVEYLRKDQIPEFELYLSFTGGQMLERLQREHGARMARALYGCVDPDAYRRVSPSELYSCSLSYMGTFAPDRREKLERLFLEPAHQRPELRFLLAGSMYPADWTVPSNLSLSSM
jgi:spore maturation protein CgeB